MFHRDGAEGACWAHNPKVGGSKPSPGNYFSSNILNVLGRNTVYKKLKLINKIATNERASAYKIQHINILKNLFLKFQIFIN